MSADDIPCLAVATKYNGYVCMCNETYCDTIEAPTALPTGQYYQYTTSNDSPGFNKKTGTFSSLTQVDPITDDVDDKSGSSGEELHTHLSLSIRL